MDELNEPIVRSRVFVLIDGVFVVRWDQSSVQELLTGKYRQYERREFGAPITDFELNQLKQAGIVERFDKDSVWLSPTPQRSKYYQSQTQTRVRAYYLHTTFDSGHLHEVETALDELGLREALLVRLRDDFVIILGENGRAFHSFDEAEAVRQELVFNIPEVFTETVVAFVETHRRD